MANAEHSKILKEGVEAWNLWRQDNKKTVPDLFESNLCDADLAGADLRDADLRDADLSGANLRSAYLRRANLRGADLRRARLVYANLVGANLSNTRLAAANLSGADLCRANLRNSDLSDADLSDAICVFTIFADVDLSQVRGLDTAKHQGPSTIGLDTFFNSKGKIPDEFLKGAGVPDIFLQHAPLLTATLFEFFSCFISYSHADRPFARRLHDSLQGRGVRCWLDEKQLLPGDHIHREVDEAIRLWDKVLLCCSEKSLTSWWVDKEISNALKKEEQLWKERGKQVLAIIPLNLDGYMFAPQWQDWKKQHLTDRLASDFTGWERDTAKFEEQVGLVREALRADASAREQRPKSLL